MWKSIFLVWLYIQTTSGGRSLFEEHKRSHIMLADAALYMTKNYIASRTNTIVIMEKCKSCDDGTENYQTDLLNHIIWHQNSSISLLLYTQPPSDYPWNYYLFIVDSVGSFRELVSEFPVILYERIFYFFIVLTVRNEMPIRDRCMTEIFKMVEALNVLNAVIMIEDKDTVPFFTYFAFNDNGVQKISPEFVNIFVNGELQMNFVFPETLENLYGYPLKVGAYLTPPFIIYDGKTNEVVELKDTSRLSGIDGDLLKLLAETMNFSIILHVSDKKSFIEAENGRTGHFKELENHEVDLLIGGLSKSLPKQEAFSNSITYHISPLVFVVRIDRYFGHLSHFLGPFENYVWFVIIASLTIGLIVIILINRMASKAFRLLVMGEKNDNASINLITIFLGNPIQHLPKTTFARFILMSWMILTLIIRNAYQGKTYDVFRVPRSCNIPKNIPELLARNFTLISSQYVDYYDAGKTFVTGTNIFSRFDYIQSKKNEEYVAVGLMDNLAYYNWQHSNGSSLTYVEEPIYFYQMTIFFRKNSILKISFDKKLKQIMASGLLANIIRRYVKFEYQNLNVDNPKAISLNNDTLRGLYLIYGIMISIALTIFLLEILSKKIKFLKNLFEI